ncbi:MAG: acyltransferase family protein [Inhella sp.]
MALSDQDISWNFTVLKAASILMVVTGHYFGGWLWVPTTVALFVFAFSSGFFTASRYREGFAFRSFWRAKIGRLMWPLLVINLFLVALLMLTGASDRVWHWHSLLAFAGLSGLLDWFGLGGNASGLGAGMWFLTVLLLFYASYPLLQALLRHKHAALPALHLGCLLGLWLQKQFDVGYMLWFTLYGFMAGVIVANHRAALFGSRGRLLTHLGLLLAVIVGMKVAGLSTSLSLIAIASVLMMPAALCLALPRTGLLDAGASLVAGAMLEIYLTHPYLPVHMSGAMAPLGYALSMLIAVAVAWALSRLSTRLQAAR